MVLEQIGLRSRRSEMAKMTKEKQETIGRNTDSLDERSSSTWICRERFSAAMAEVITKEAAL